MAGDATADMFDFQCSICQEIFVDPRRLECTHSFCLACLCKWVQASTDTQNGICPLCRRTFKIPAGGVTNIQRNVFFDERRKRVTGKTDVSVEADDSSATCNIRDGNNRQGRSITSSDQETRYATATTRCDGYEPTLSDRLGRWPNFEPSLQEGLVFVGKISLTKQSWGVAGMVMMGQTLWIVHTRPTSLIAYHVLCHVSSHNQPQTFSIQKEAEPTDMFQFPTGQSSIVISDCKNKHLLWLTLEQRSNVWRMTSQRSMKVNYDPQGLSVNGNRLLVCGCDAIHILSTSGEETDTVALPNMTPCKAVSQLTSTGFIVKDAKRGHIVSVDEKGEVQRLFEFEQEFYAYDLVCHGHYIYVSDLINDCVYEMRDDGLHVNTLISRADGLFGPGRMCKDDAGCFLVEQGKPDCREAWICQRLS